jgi:hypothetical protein
MAKKKDKVKQIEAEEKSINVVSFEEVKNRQGQSENMEDYFSRQDLRVTRGELYQVLYQIMGNIDKELMDSFQRVVVIHNLVDVVVQALIEKQLLNDADLFRAQQTLVEELKKRTEKGDENNGSK